jgi:4-amino-4-deoxy-L-arabinose transferase-like glycosyltransferase
VGPVLPSAWRRVRSAFERYLVTWLSALTVVVVCIIVGRLHAFFFQHAGPIGFDDGYTMALGERLIDGKWLPYVDGCSHRGPLLYWAAALSQLATGRFGWTGARVLSIVTTYASLLGVFGVGLAARRPLAGALASVFLAWSALVVLAASPGYAITGEGVASPFVVFSFLFATLGLDAGTHGRTSWLLVAGVFAALAALAKQTALPMILPILLWVFAQTWPLESSLRARRAAPAALLLGFLGTLGVVVAIYAVNRELRTFWYWYYTYNADIYMSGYRNANVAGAFAGFMNGQPWAVGGFVFSMAASFARPFALMTRSPSGILRAYAASGLECTAASIALLLFVSAVAALRFWPHYFLCVLPFVGLVIGLRGEEALGSRGGRSALAGLVLLSLTTAFLGFAADHRLAQFRQEARSGGHAPARDAAVCRIIDSYSAPGESLFVWGFNGDLYLSCRRRPATRFTYLTLVAGTVPPDWSTLRDDRVARGSRELLLRDLEKERPPVILDADNPMWPVSFARIPVIRRFIEARYCPQGTSPAQYAGTVSVWVRKDRAPCAK